MPRSLRQKREIENLDNTINVDQLGSVVAPIRLNLTDEEIAEEMVAPFDNLDGELDYLVENTPILKEYVDDHVAVLAKQEAIMAEQRQLLANLQHHRFVS